MQQSSANPSSHEQDLRDIVQSQSRQVSALTAYKSLCERRILDLSPNHPLPVREAHIGTRFDSDSSDDSAESLSERDWEALKATVTALEKQLADQRAVIDSLEQGRKTAATDRSTGTESLKSAAEVAPDEVTALRTHSTHLQSRLADAEAELTALRTAAPQLAMHEPGESAQIRALQVQLEQCRSELSSALAQKAHFQSVYNEALQRASEKEASECRAKGEARELQKALRGMWDGAAAAARSAQARDEELSKAIADLERRKFDIEIQAMQAKDAHRRVVKETSALEQDYRQRIQSLQTLLDTAAADGQHQVRELQDEIKQLKVSLAQVQQTEDSANEGRDCTVAALTEQLEHCQKDKDDAVRQLATARTRCELLEKELISLRQSTREELLALMEENQGLKVALKPLPVVVSADSSFTEMREKEATERAMALEQTIAICAKRLSNAINPLCLILNLPKNELWTDIAEVTALAEEVLPVAEKTIERMKNQRLEQTAVQGRVLSVAGRPGCEQCAELQSLKLQLREERNARSEACEEVKAAELQTNNAVKEMQKYRQQIRTYVEEISKLQAEASSLRSDLEKQSLELSSLIEEKHQGDSLLSHVIRLAPITSRERRLLTEFVAISGEMASSQKARRYLEARVRELEAARTPETARAVQIEKMSLLRAEYQSDSLQRRLAQIEGDLSTRVCPALRTFKLSQPDSFPCSGSHSPEPSGRRSAMTIREETRLSGTIPGGKR